jgi:uncharacterized protein (DUF1800 family)
LEWILFYPPNAAGWTGSKSWIDSSTLMTRMRLLEITFEDSEVTSKPKEKEDINTENLSKKMQASID